MDPTGWDEWSDGWVAAFGLAWESHCAGSPGVGAVVVDARGTVVASGRSRRGEVATEPNQLTGSRVAHAEINALAGLGVEEYDGMTLLATLEPCLLCAAAIAIAHVPVVRFAGPDPMWRFLQGLPRWDPRLAERWPSVVGPMPGKWGAWGALMPIIERLERNPSGPRIEEYDRTLPELTGYARTLVSDGTAAHLRTLSLETA